MIHGEPQAFRVATRKETGFLPALAAKYWPDSGDYPFGLLYSLRFCGFGVAGGTSSCAINDRIYSAPLDTVRVVGKL